MQFCQIWFRLELIGLLKVPVNTTISQSIYQRTIILSLLSLMSHIKKDDITIYSCDLILNILSAHSKKCILGGILTEPARKGEVVMNKM